MRLLLARHGETVDNVAGIYAGITDSPLTNHGVLQASRLGSHLAETGAEIRHIFSSDLQRAFKTAEAVRTAQKSPPTEVKQLEVLREQDFGFYEGKHFSQRPKDDGKGGKDAYLELDRQKEGFKDVESKASMTMRADTFLDENLLDILKSGAGREATVLVVAHGIILNHLWRVILRRFHPGNVSVASSVLAADRGLGLEYLGGWSNTGYLDMEIRPKSHNISSSATTSQGSELPLITITAQQSYEPSLASPTTSPLKSGTQLPHLVNDSSPLVSLLPDLTLRVLSVNTLTHLRNLKKTRGGLGSLKHDSNQTTMDSFFKKRKIG